MTKRGANFKTIAGVTALGGMVTVGAWGVSATAQADNGGLPAKKPHPTSQATNTDPTKGSTNATPQVAAPKLAAPAVTTAAPTYPTFPPIIPSTINLHTTFPTIPPLVPSTINLSQTFPTIPPLIPSTFQLPVFWFF